MYKASSDEKIPQQLLRPNEQIKTHDGALIINYEVPPEDDVVYAGGIKGIRALRQQRDQLSDQIEDDLQKQAWQKTHGKEEEKR